MNVVIRKTSWWRVTVFEVVRGCSKFLLMLTAAAVSADSQR